MPVGVGDALVLDDEVGVGVGVVEDLVEVGVVLDGGATLDDVPVLPPLPSPIVVVSEPLST